MRYCTVKDCKNKYEARGYCRLHYSRMYYLGRLDTKLEMHGMHRTPEYSTWCHMKNRVYNKNSRSYKYYGDRGITICDRWLKSFSDFYKDMGEKPTPSHSLDRIDNNGNYEPSNCRWATAKEQANNKRKMSMSIRNTSGVVGVSMDSQKLGWIVSYKHRYIKWFKNKEDAILARKKLELSDQT